MNFIIIQKNNCTLKQLDYQALKVYIIDRKINIFFSFYLVYLVLCKVREMLLEWTWLNIFQQILQSLKSQLWQMLPTLLSNMRPVKPDFAGRPSLQDGFRL